MNNLHFLELNSYSKPEIKESKRDEWVEYGEDNDYFQYLIDRYTNSTTNNAIINSCTRLIYGRGLSATDASRKPNEYAQMMALFPKDCVRHLVSDLKMLGQCAVQLIYTADRKKIKAVYHVPIQLLRAEKCNEKGEVEAYYFSDNWEDTKKFPPKRIPAFGYSKEAIEIMYIRPYSVGMKYYSYVDYHGALPYAQLEEDSCYLINEVNCGFSGRAVVNFNNGVPSEEQQIMIKSKVLSQLTGTQGEKVIVAFNNNAESKTTVDSMPVNDAPDLYSTLSEEAMRKIMLGHSVTSPLLFGVANSNGFSSNSDELESSFVLFNNMVIKPIQEILLDAFEEILAFNGVSLNLFFRTLKPLEFTDLENAQTTEQVQEETGLELSEEPKEKSALDKFIEDAGEEPHEDWLLIDEFEVDYDTDEEENELLNKEPKQSLLSKIVNLVSTGTARPNSKSEQDENIDGFKFITRYVYAGEQKPNSREFCQKMMKAGKIYRKEDIIQMGNLPVNKGWGPKGADTYSIWLYKGGANCYHRFNKQVYVSFEGYGIDVNSPKASRIASRKAEQYGYVIKNPKLVSTRPIDMPNRGFLPKNK
jgi:hypothetical protein